LIVTAASAFLSVVFKLDLIALLRIALAACVFTLFSADFMLGINNFLQCGRQTLYHGQG
jgi:hypothetical protein